jgi:hypothetical protein
MFFSEENRFEDQRKGTKALIQADDAEGLAANSAVSRAVSVV